MKADIVLKDERWKTLPLYEIAQVSFDLIENNILHACNEFEISLLATDDFEMTDLNNQFRGYRTPTNILSWPEYKYEQLLPGKLPKRIGKRFNYCKELDFLGNLAISFDQCSTEAAQRNLNFKDHITHLLIHGCLHLIGFDHENELDATLMENIEKRLLVELGIKNPYILNG